MAMARSTTLHPAGFTRLAVGLALIHVSWVWISAARQSRITAHDVKREPVCETSSRPTPPATIIVPAWNERGTIERCIRSLKLLQYPNWEAVILAGGSDDTQRVAQTAIKGDHRFQVIEQPPNGKNAALNIGARAARHDILVLLDADCEVAPDWLEALLSALPDANGAAVGTFSPRKRSWISAAEQLENEYARKVLRSNSLQGSGTIALHRSTLGKIGGFPEDVPVGVDWDLGVRLQQSGLPVNHASTAHVLTDRPSSVAELWKNEVRWHRAHLAGIWRHRSVLLDTPRNQFNHGYFYAFSASVTGMTCATMLVAALSEQHRRTVRNALALLWIWILGRQASTGLGLAVATRNWNWLRNAWTVSGVLPIRFAASTWALATPGRTTRHFKGPRDALATAPAFEPTSIEHKIALDFAASLVSKADPKYLRIVADDADVAAAIFRRLPAFPGRIIVPNEEMRLVADTYGLEAVSRGYEDCRAEVLLSAFARTAYSGEERTVIALERNQLSYRLLLPWRRTLEPTTPFLIRRKLGSRTLVEAGGTLTPPFLWRWAVSLLAGTRFPGYHFLFAQRAMDRALDRSFLWRFGTTIVLRADRTGDDE